MLVSVLVLGVMGCGKKNLETGNEIPYALHGTWVLNGVATDITDAPHFIVTANEVTVRLPTVDSGALIAGTVQYAFGAEYGGNKNDPEAQQLTLKLTRIVDGIDWGTYRFAYVAANAGEIGADTLTVEAPVPTWESSLVPYYEFYAMFAEGNVFDRVLTP